MKYLMWMSVLLIVLMGMTAGGMRAAYASVDLMLNTSVIGTVDDSLNTFRWQTFNLSQSGNLLSAGVILKGGSSSANVTATLRNSTGMIATSSPILISGSAGYAIYNLPFPSAPYLLAASAYGNYNLSLLQSSAVGITWTENSTNPFIGGEGQKGSSWDFYLELSGNADNYLVSIWTPANGTVFNTNEMTMVYSHNASTAKTCSHFYNATEYADGLTQPGDNRTVGYTGLPAGYFTFKSKCGNLFSETRSGLVNIGQDVAITGISTHPDFSFTFSFNHYAMAGSTCKTYLDGELFFTDSMPIGNSTVTHLIAAQPVGVHNLLTNCSDFYGAVYQDDADFGLGLYGTAVELYRYGPDYSITDNSLTYPWDRDVSRIIMPATMIRLESGDGEVKYCGVYDNGTASFSDVIGTKTYEVSVLINGDCDSSGNIVAGTAYYEKYIGSVVVESNTTHAFFAHIGSDFVTNSNNQPNPIMNYFFLIWRVAFWLFGIALMVLVAMLAQRNWIAPIFVAIGLCVIAGILAGMGWL